MRSLVYVCLMMVVAVSAAAQVTVNCGVGQKVQDAIDGNPSPVEITVSGICAENVLIRDKDVTLKGTSPADRIQSLVVRGSVDVTIKGLSFNDNAGTAVSVMRGANVDLTSCRFENNRIGLQITFDANVTGNGLTFTNNATQAVSVSDSQFFCTACDIASTANPFAVLANRGAIVSLLDSVVTANRGIAATDGGTIADLDCANATTTHPCAMNAAVTAALAFGDSTVSIIGADFTGQLFAFDRGTVAILGSRQTAATSTNIADFYGRITIAAFTDFPPVLQSRVRGINAFHFAQVLATDASIIDGAVTLASEARSSIDPTVTVRTVSR